MPTGKPASVFVCVCMRSCVTGVLVCVFVSVCVCVCVFEGGVCV